MKRLLTLAVVALCLMPATAAAGQTSMIDRGPPRPEQAPLAPPKPHPEGRWRGPCSDWFVGENLTPALWNANPERGRRMMMRLIVCVFAVYAPGESVYALAIADRESGFYPWALNSSSGCAGLFQHITWEGRADAFLKPWMFRPGYHPSAFDPRANAIVTAKMVAAGGWGPWS